MLCAARQRLRAFRTATRGRSRKGAAPCFFYCSAVQTQGRSVNETLVLCILPSKADAQLADREARMELVVVLVELHQLLLHHPVCSLLGIGVIGVNVRIQVLMQSPPQLHPPPCLWVCHTTQPSAPNTSAATMMVGRLKFVAINSVIQHTPFRFYQIREVSSFTSLLSAYLLGRTSR